MDVFTGCGMGEDKLKNFQDTIDKIYGNLKEYNMKEDLSELLKIRENFAKKINDFYSENRKLNIGVVGQVKSGKSSFLNALLFEGKDILPKASTPKTATLTKMEYSEDNVIEIEYYNEDEWKVIERNASIDLEDEVYTSARDLVGMVESNGVKPHEYLLKGREKIEFDTYEELIDNLNDYVGEDGKFTPIVKAVTLYLNKEEFKGISIVDTPGLNDPIASRTIRTKEFIEVCDVVFFLSQTGSFLDKSDWELLSSQLPQKGVKKLILLASKYDSGIRDVLREKKDDDIFGGDESKADNVKDACKLISKKLNKRMKEKVKEYEKNTSCYGGADNIAKIVRECDKPILISSMAYNMSKKNPQYYSEEELNVYDGIINFSDNISEDLILIGNIDKVRQEFTQIIEEKEKIMDEKSQNFIPTAKEELRANLRVFLEKSKKRCALLSGNDREQLLNQKRDVNARINGIKSDIITIFGEWNVKLENEKINALKDLRNASKEYSSINEKTGTITKTKSYSVSTSKWYNPFSWGSSRKEYYTYDEHYSYVDVADVLDNLRNYVMDSTNTVEAVFTEAINMKEMKRKLLNVVINNFDMGSEKYDCSLFKIMVENTINKIVFPIIKIDASEVMSSIAIKFSGEITSSSEKNSLRESLINSISVFFDKISGELDKSIVDFKCEMSSICENIQSLLLKNINKEFDEIIVKVDKREEEIGKYNKYIEKLDKEINKL